MCKGFPHNWSRDSRKFREPQDVTGTMFKPPHVNRVCGQRRGLRPALPAPPRIRRGPFAGPQCVDTCTRTLDPEPFPQNFKPSPHAACTSFRSLCSPSGKRTTGLMAFTQVLAFLEQRKNERCLTRTALTQSTGSKAVTRLHSQITHILRQT